MNPFSFAANVIALARSIRTPYPVTHMGWEEALQAAEEEVGAPK